MYGSNLADKPEVATLLRCIASLLKLRYDEAGADAAVAGSGAATAAAGGGGLMAKFLAARSKIDVQQARKGKGGGAAAPQRALRTFDPTAADGVPPQGDVLACRLPADCAAPVQARLVHALRSSTAGYHLVLADDYEQVGAHAELCSLLLRSAAAFFVVPSAPEHGGQVLFCGGRALGTAAAYDRCTTAVVAQAKRDKSVGGAFCKLAQTPERLGELVGAGAAAARRLHLFSRTAEPLRAQLQLDAEAHYSVTDEEMADRLTDEVSRLAGVSAQTAIVDATACVGGNALSFAKRFERVVAIESDATRLAMLRHNAAVLGRTNVRCLGGDCLELLPQLSGADGSSIDGGNGGFVVFLDPPWGGLSYKDHDSCELELSGTPFPEVVSRFLRLRGCLWCVCKAPFNFDRSTLRGLPGAATAEPPRLLSMSKTVKCIFVRAAATAPTPVAPPGPSAPPRVPEKRAADAAPSDGVPKKMKKKKKRPSGESGESILGERESGAPAEGLPIKEKKKKKKKKKRAAPPSAS